MKILTFACCISFFISCNSNNNSYPSYQSTKMSLEEKEKDYPTSFLRGNITYRKNLIGEWVLEGTITNTATLAIFKDVILKISYYSKTQTPIGIEEKTLYDYFKPNSSQNFKIKTFGPEGTTTLNFQILSASQVN